MNGIRGDGICTANEALQALLENPAQLELARGRFSQPPPSYTSHLTHNCTQSQSPDPPDEDREARRGRKFKLRMDHGASYPSSQFKDETAGERARVAKVAQDRTRPTPHLDGRDWTEVARENVKKRWKEQGIWNDEWKPRGLWTWKHEEPLSPDSRVAQELQPMLPRRRFLEREASRPFHQFMYQLSQKRHRIQDEAWPSDSPVSDVRAMGGALLPGQSQTTFISQDINTVAYQRVKDTWVKRGIWYDKWGVLPGMTWKHEHPVEDMLLEEFGPDSPSSLAADGVKTVADDMTGDTEQRPTLFGHLVPSPIISSLPANDACGSIHEEPSIEEPPGLFHGLGPSSSSQPRGTSPSQTPRKHNTFLPARRSTRLRSKRKASPGASDKTVESENSQNCRTNKRRRTGT